MLERLVANQSVIAHLLSTDKMNLSPTQWSSAVQLLSILHPVVQLTNDLMTTTQYPAQSVVIPMVVGLRSALMSGRRDSLHELLLRLVEENFTYLLDDVQLCAATVAGLCVCC